ncbi:hypothetical protein GKE82_10175 [Conexibacter sp. W3-3-2]|uniref:hypothetical protein n=1 Tax=Conexibacter sp. W3-3-2 TaxID=2675227 RepID=UPI0012B7E448|nr:hypothetical protein [Conexibacter sp. W3-3-2]MTD44645.1 hypothetical protein [Conexibacter sp. W3-3-2]
MRPTDSLPRLIAALNDRGVQTRALDDDLHSLDGGAAHTAWAAFCELALSDCGAPFESYGQMVSVGDDAHCNLLAFESLWWEPRESNGGDAQVYTLQATRHFSLEDRNGDYVGTHALRLEIECAGDPTTFSADDTATGYAGPVRPDVSDTQDDEFDDWAGHVRSWAATVQATRAFGALTELRPACVYVMYDD